MTNPDHYRGSVAFPLYPAWDLCTICRWTACLLACLSPFFLSFKTASLSLMNSMQYLALEQFDIKTSSKGVGAHDNLGIREDKQYKIECKEHYSGFSLIVVIFQRLEEYFFNLMQFIIPRWWHLHSEYIKNWSLFGVIWGLHLWYPASNRYRISTKWSWWKWPLPHKTCLYMCGDSYFSTQALCEDSEQ